MKTAVIYYSAHHGNTGKLLERIKGEFPDVELIDVTSCGAADLSGYDRIGIASGIYFNGFAKQLLCFAEENLPENKPVFFICTGGAPLKSSLNSVRALAKRKNCRVTGEYKCLGFDTFGPLKLVGGIAKGHPDESELCGAVEFYRNLPE